MEKLIRCATEELEANIRRATHAYQRILELAIQRYQHRLESVFDDSEEEFEEECTCPVHGDLDLAILALLKSRKRGDRW